MTPRAPFKSPSLALPTLALLISMMCSQCGAALAKGLFPRVGAPGTAALRLAISSLVLIAVWRPWRLRPSRAVGRSILIYGIAMGIMNCTFYLALTRIPLGITVALEFTGPLGVALATSRRRLDLVWIAFAALGIWGLLPLGRSASLDPLGIAYALAAGVCWALYILFGQRAGAEHGGRTVALGTLVGAMVIVPVGLASAGRAVLAPALLPLASAVALLSTALPYSLEMVALGRMPARTFGVLMSLAPAVGALSGLLFLGEHLGTLQWLAIGSIVLASGGVAATNVAVPRTVLPE